MTIQSMLFRWGITTWQQDIITMLPNTPSTNFQVGKNLPTDVGFIYGLSTYADSQDSDGNQLITTTQAMGIYLSLVNGASTFFNQIRLDDLLNVYAGSPVVKPNQFMPVNLPIFDLSKSNYFNPFTYSSAVVTTVIHLKLWYIQKSQFDFLVSKGEFSVHKAAPTK